MAFYFFNVCTIKRFSTIYFIKKNVIATDPNETFRCVWDRVCWRDMIAQADRHATQDHDDIMYVHNTVCIILAKMLFLGVRQSSRGCG